MDAQNDGSREDLGYSIRKIRVPQDLLELVEEVARVVNATPKWTLDRLLLQVGYLVADKPELFGHEYAQARRQLDGKGRFAGGVGTPEIDESRLARSNNGTGFAGVSANGKGFSARLTVNGKVTTIGTYATPIMAAEARRVYCLKHNIPYGRVADYIENEINSTYLRSLDPELKRRLAIHELTRKGETFTDSEITAEDRQWQDTFPLSPSDISPETVGT